MFPENTNLFKENQFSLSGKKTQRNPLSSHLRAVQGPVWSTHNLLLAYGHRRTKGQDNLSTVNRLETIPARSIFRLRRLLSGYRWAPVCNTKGCTAGSFDGFCIPWSFMPTKWCPNALESRLYSWSPFSWNPGWICLLSFWRRRWSLCPQALSSPL